MNSHSRVVMEERGYVSKETVVLRWWGELLIWFYQLG